MSSPTTLAIPPQPGPGYYWDANDWCWYAPNAPSSTTPTTARVVPPQPDPGYCWDANNWCWYAPNASASNGPSYNQGGN